MGRLELSPFAGGTFGTRIFLDSATDIRVGKSFSYGLRAAWSVDRAFSLEGTYSFTRSHLRAVDPATGATLAPPAAIDITTYELDALYGFGRGRMRGYAGLGAGAMTFRPFVSSQAAEPGTRFVANVALGGKLFLGDRLALRVDGRYRFRAADERTGAVACGDDGCFGFTTDLYSSAEVTGGLSYRFGGSLTPPERPPGREPPAEARRRFFPAAGEIVLLEVVPWVFNRYVTDEDFARISPETIRDNFRSGFTFDHDAFKMNQIRHPHHGGLFFNAARSNGYEFWESGAFAFAGSFLWECCMENDPPAINDLVNTTLGGMALGEISHRLAVMLRDNTATGFTRFSRELGAALIDPVGGFNRLLDGDAARQYPNTAERFPSHFHVAADLGYRHVGGGAADPDQKLLTLSVVYGNPFAGEIRKPFDTSSIEIDLNDPGDTLSRVEGRGILRGWELTEPDARTRHVLGVFQEYTYLSNESQVFGAQIISAGLLSRYNLRAHLTAATDIAAFGFPLAGIQTTDFKSPETGRTYDYAPGGGARAAGHLWWDDSEILSLGYGIAWARTVNGASKGSTLQFVRASARFPFTGFLGVGAGYAWYSRQTSYPSGFFEGRRTQSEWRVYASLWL